VGLSEADDLTVGRGDDDLAHDDGRGGRHERGGFVFKDVLTAGEIEPVDAAVVGADEYAAAGAGALPRWFANLVRERDEDEVCERHLSSDIQLTTTWIRWRSTRAGAVLIRNR
jgi:hypothetical protein